MRMKMKNKIAGAAAFMLSAFLLPAVTAYAEETTAVSTDVSTVTGSGIEKTVMTINPTELPDTEITPESVTDDISDSEPKFPSGNGHLLEDVLDENVNRQFLTIQSKNGNTFYIIVDKDDKGGENVYFMNLVDEYDLLAFAEDFPEETKAKKPATTEPVVTDKGGKPVSTIPETDENGEPVSIPVSNPGNSNNKLLLLIGILVLGGGAAFYFFKVKGKPTNQKKPDIDIDDDEYDDDPEINENSDE